MRGQTGFFDIDERLRGLSAKCDKLERLNALVDFELFRGDLERAVLRDKQDEHSASIRMRKCRRMRDEGRAESEPSIWRPPKNLAVLVVCDSMNWVRVGGCECGVRLSF